MPKLRLDDILEVISKESQNMQQTVMPKISPITVNTSQVEAETAISLADNLKKNLNFGDTTKIVHLNVVGAHHQSKVSVADNVMPPATEKDEEITILTLEEADENKKDAIEKTDIWANEMLHASEELSAKAKAMRMEPLYLEDSMSDDDILVLTEQSETEITVEIQQMMNDWLQKTDNETIKKIIQSTITDKLNK